MKNKYLKNFALMAVATVTITMTIPANAAKIGMCVATTGAAFDLAWKARLEGQGHTVTIVPEATSSTTVAAANYDLLIVSSNVTSGGFRSGPGVSQPIPYLIYEQVLFPDFFGGGSANPNGTAVNIVNSSHPLLAGTGLVNGSVTISSTSSAIPTSSSTRSANVQVIANASSGDASLQVLEKDVSNGTRTFPGRRIGVPSMPIGPSETSQQTV